MNPEYSQTEVVAIAGVRESAVSRTDSVAGDFEGNLLSRRSAGIV